MTSDSDFYLRETEWVRDTEHTAGSRKVLTSSLGNARIPGAPWSVKYTNTWSLGPLPRQPEQRCITPPPDSRRIGFLISCFNSADSPLHHFSFGFGRVPPEHCQEVFWGHILPETANQESQILLGTCLNAYEKHQNSRLPCSLWERLCIRQSRWACLSVSQGWGSWKH